ncbi:MAG TPA: hypothetical protein VGM06_06180 [Polyangiaceae bacterium]|jgi:hypothetical protein
MPNERGDAYALTALCPIRDDARAETSFATQIRERLKSIELDARSPMAKVPNTYLCRLFVLDEVPYQDSPAAYERLENKYLVFVCELHGALDPYLTGMWERAGAMIRRVWEHCVGFEEVSDAPSFVRYMKRCQVTTTYYFNGSTDEPLAEQLKALYLKQEFAKFVAAHQGAAPEEIRRAFGEFVGRVQPSSVAGPTWRPGASELDGAVVDASGSST